MNRQNTISKVLNIKFKRIENFKISNITNEDSPPGKLQLFVRVINILLMSSVRKIKKSSFFSILLTI